MLGSPLTCFDARLYGSLVLADTEGEFHPEEADKLFDDVSNEGLGLLVWAEWYSASVSKTMAVFDGNQRRWITPLVGGANVPSLNRLLRRMGAAFASDVVEGKLTLAMPTDPEDKSDEGVTVGYGLGTFAARLPPQARFVDLEKYPGKPALSTFPFGEGRVLLYGDTGCFDHNDGATAMCPGVAQAMVAWAAGFGDREEGPFPERAQSVGEGGLVREDWPVPEEDEALEPDLLDKIMRPLAW